MNHACLALSSMRAFLSSSEDWSASSSYSAHSTAQVSRDVFLASSGRGSATTERMSVQRHPGAKVDYSLVQTAKRNANAREKGQVRVWFAGGRESITSSLRLPNPSKMRGTCRYMLSERPGRESYHSSANSPPTHTETTTGRPTEGGVDLPPKNKRTTRGPALT